MIRILHITECYGGGIKGVLYPIINSTTENHKFENILIYNLRNSPEYDVNSLKAIASYTKLYEVKMARNIKIFQDIKALLQIIKIIKKEKPDIVHSHSSKAGAIGRIAAFICGIKSFYSPHGYYFLRKDISFLKKLFYFIIELLLGRLLFAKTISCGDTEHIYSKIFSKSILVRNGINREELNEIISTKKNFEPNKQFTIATLGRLTPQKGVDLYSEIVKKSCKNYRFIWIGDGEQRKTLEKYENVHITGWIDKKEALKIVANSDIYLQTSQWEGLPLSVLEAMALGKAVVATNVIGNKDAIENNKNGLLGKTAEELSLHIKKLEENSTLRKKFGKTSNIIANNKFNNSKNIEILSNIYKTY